MSFYLAFFLQQNQWANVNVNPRSRLSPIDYAIAPSPSWRRRRYCVIGQGSKAPPRLDRAVF